MASTHHLPRPPREVIRIMFMDGPAYGRVRQEMACLGTTIWVTTLDEGLMPYVVEQYVAHTDEYHAYCGEPF